MRIYYEIRTKKGSITLSNETAALLLVAQLRKLTDTEVELTEIELSQGEYINKMVNNE